MVPQRMAHCSGDPLLFGPGGVGGPGPVVEGGVIDCLFVVPPEIPEDMFSVELARKKRFACYPPYGVGILCAKLKSKGLSVSILDLNFEILKAAQEDGFSYGPTWTYKLSEAIGTYFPKSIGISSMFTMSHRQLLDIADFIKETYPEIRVLAGGIHPTNSKLKYKSIDVVIPHEADDAILEYFVA